MYVKMFIIPMEVTHSRIKIIKYTTNTNMQSIECHCISAAVVNKETKKIILRLMEENYSLLKNLKQ